MFKPLTPLCRLEQLPSSKTSERRDVLQTFTIIGLSTSGDSLAHTVEAHSAAEAELAVGDDFEYVACVLEGQVSIEHEEIYPDEREWSVFSFYIDNEQRHGTTVQAKSAREAEVCANEALNEDYDAAMDTPLELCVCGVVLGQQMVADLYAGDEGWARSEYAQAMLREEAEAEALEQATKTLPEIGARSRQSGLAQRRSA